MLLQSPPARPSSPLADSPSRAVRSLTLRAQLVRLLLLASAGALLQIAWVMLWPLSYRLTHGNDFTYQYLIGHDAVWRRVYDLLMMANGLAPGIEPPHSLTLLVNAFTITCGVATVGYIAGVLLLDLGISDVKGALWIVVAVELASQALLFFMPGLFTSDIFSYIMYGQISATYSLNPYIFPPSFFPGNPVLYWIHPIWHNTPSIYGPLWTDVSWVIAQASAGLSLVNQTFVYKALMNVVQLANLGLVWWLLGRFAPQNGSRRARLAAFTVFAWNPLMLFDVAGNAHNDGLMVFFVLLALVPIAGWRRRPRWNPIPSAGWLAGLVSLTLSALVKYTTGVVGLFYVVAWAAQLRTWSRRALWIGLAAVACLGLTLVLALPWLDGPSVLQPMLDAAQGNLYTNSVPDLISQTLAAQILDPWRIDPTATLDAVRWWMKLLTRLAFVVYLAWEARQVWGVARRRDAAALRDAVVTSSVRTLLVLMLVVLMWVLEWYFTWPLALVTLLGWHRMLTKVTVAYTLTALPIFYIHNYLDSLMPGALVVLYAGLPLLLPLGAWAVRRLHDVAWMREIAEALRGPLPEPPRAGALYAMRVEAYDEAQYS